MSYVCLGSHLGRWAQDAPRGRGCHIWSADILYCPAWYSDRHPSNQYSFRQLRYSGDLDDHCGKASILHSKTRYKLTRLLEGIALIRLRGSPLSHVVLVSTCRGPGSSVQRCPSINVSHAYSSHDRCMDCHLGNRSTRSRSRSILHAK